MMDRDRTRGRLISLLPFSPCLVCAGTSFTHLSSSQNSSFPLPFSPPCFTFCLAFGCLTLPFCTPHLFCMLCLACTPFCCLPAAADPHPHHHHHTGEEREGSVRKRRQWWSFCWMSEEEEEGRWKLAPSQIPAHLQRKTAGLGRHLTFLFLEGSVIQSNVSSSLWLASMSQLSIIPSLLIVTI